MFRTELPIAPATDQLSRTARVLTVGSCFADSIGSRLLANKVEALVNPFGTVFQPLALAKLLRAAAGEEVDWQQHVVEARGRWQSYDLHGSIGAESPVELLRHIQELVRRTGEFLRNADVVLLTLGTAWAYRLRETGELVNNCHKQPADLFTRELLTPDEIINSLAETHAQLRRINPKLRFVLTVSPVRHLKDTLPLNAVSKSVLRVATHIVSDLLPGMAYFPAYELLVDDLRDYRFYAADMLHPSEVAEDYIWDKFTRTYFDADFGRFRKEWASVRQALGHRPLHIGAPEHRQFLESTLGKLEQLSLRRVDVSDELQTVRTQLDALPVPRQPEPVAEVENDEERIDIGEGAALAELAAAALPPEISDQSGRPPRLSLEEFRSQKSSRRDRGRRDGRGKGQASEPSENEQFQSTEIFASELETTTAPVVDALPIEESGIAISTTETGLAVDAATDQELPKKKKRRSRGGAKRTARKHALRLAAGEPDQAPATNTDAGETAASTGTAADQPDAQPEGRKPSVIAKSTPVKRGSRREETGRVPRAALFATPPEAPAAAVAPIADAELPPLPASEVVAVASVLSEAVALSAAAPATPASRSSRNRKKKRPVQQESASTSNQEPTTPTIGNAEQPAGMSDAPSVAVNAVPAASAAAVATAAPVTLTPAEVPAPAPAPRSNRAKRVVSGARAEKPAVDTPVVPVPDAAQVRTQVAAGRMTGSSASLVEPDATPKKAASAPRAAKKAAPASVAPKAASKAPASKSKAAKAAQDAAAAPPMPAGALPQTLPATPKPKAAKAKAAPKAEATAPKATVAKPKAAKPKAPKKPAKPA